MNILLFLWGLLVSHWSDILVLLVFITTMVILWKRGQKKLVKKIIRGLVVRAEKELGSKTGELKKELVYNMLPWILKIILSREDLGRIIDDAASWLKKKMDDNPDMNLLSYNEEAKE